MVLRVIDQIHLEAAPTYNMNESIARQVLRKDSLDESFLVLELGDLLYKNQILLKTIRWKLLKFTGAGYGD